MICFHRFVKSAAVGSRHTGTRMHIFQSLPNSVCFAFGLRSAFNAPAPKILNLKNCKSTKVKEYNQQQQFTYKTVLIVINGVIMHPSSSLRRPPFLWASWETNTVQVKLPSSTSLTAELTFVGISANSQLYFTYKTAVDFPAICCSQQRCYMSAECLPKAGGGVNIKYFICDLWELLEVAHSLRIQHGFCSLGMVPSSVRVS